MYFLFCYFFQCSHRSIVHQYHMFSPFRSALTFRLIVQGFWSDLQKLLLLCSRADALPTLNWFTFTLTQLHTNIINVVCPLWEFHIYFFRTAPEGSTIGTCCELHASLVSQIPPSLAELYCRFLVGESWLRFSPKTSSFVCVLMRLDRRLSPAETLMCSDLTGGHDKSLRCCSYIF